MKKIVPIIFFLIVFFPGTTDAQPVINPSQSDVVWEYSRITIGEESFDLGGKFITYSDHRVEWIQNGRNDNSFTTTSFSGVWNNASRKGSIVFNVTMDESSGTIEFGKEGKQVKVTVNIHNPGRNDSYFRFTIDTINSL